MRSCPHACPGYRPAPEAERPEQEVHVLGAAWHRGHTCPGVVLEDRGLHRLLYEYQALEHWCHGNPLSWWDEQPAWWTAAIREVRRMRDVIEDEKMPHAAE